MIHLSPGQSYEISDDLISDFPWYDFLNVDRFTILCSDSCLPSIEMVIPVVSQPSVTALFLLHDVTECILPPVGYKRLQFSEMNLENFRSHQLENSTYKIFDGDFIEPSFLFNRGEIFIS